MNIKYTKLIEEEYEVDIPLEVIEVDYNGYVEDAVENYIKESTKVDEYVEIENIRKGKLDYEDEQWEELEYFRQQREEDEIMRDYYASLGVK
nr:MAG TPA: hypothetical protein [Caudoviricetes sp.]